MVQKDLLENKRSLDFELAGALMEDFVNQKADADSPITSPGRKSKHHDRRLHGDHFATIMIKGRYAVCENQSGA